MPGGDPELSIRRMVPDDLPGALDLLRCSLGWSPDGHEPAFFAWKHQDNPFGPSPAWVALDEGRVVGLRVLLRWRFRVGNDLIDAVRAVDTATDPAYRGRGLFTDLTLTAVRELTEEGVGFVFNTPNSASRPGYLKMGWRVLGRPKVAIRSRPGSLPRLGKARVPAEKWSEDTRAGEAAVDVFADERALDELLSSRPAPAGSVTTHRTPAFYRWRYAFGPLNYRVVTIGDSIAEGFAVFRVRRRGTALETAVVDVVVPDDDPRRRTSALRAAARAGVDAGADFAMVVGEPRPLQAGFVPAPRLGPILTWRALTMDEPPAALDQWSLGLGDIELF